MSKSLIHLSCNFCFAYSLCLPNLGFMW